MISFESPLRKSDPDFLAALEDLVRFVQPEYRGFLEKALHLAWTSHKGQTRLGGAPYVVHPFRVAKILADEWGIRDHEVLSAGLLHDTVEDTELLIDEIDHTVSRYTSDLVHHLTKYPFPELAATKTWKEVPFTFETPKPDAPKADRERIYLDWLAKGPNHAIIVKCADRVDNLRDMGGSGWTPRKKLSYADEARKILALARNRLGGSHPAALGLDKQIREIERTVVESPTKGLRR